MESNSLTPASITPAEYKKQMELRNKPFAELTTEQQIGRLVEEIRGIRYLSHRMNELEIRTSKLEQHSHVDGKVVVPITSSLGFLAAGSASTRDLLA